MTGRVVTNGNSVGWGMRAIRGGRMGEGVNHELAVTDQKMEGWRESPIAIHVVSAREEWLGAKWKVEETRNPDYW